MKKILVVCATLDLYYPFSATPYKWQLFKGLYEMGLDVIVVPYRGRSIRSLWWRCYKNPCRLEGNLFAFAMNNFPKVSNSQSEKIGLATRIAQSWVRPKWEKCILHVLRKEKDVDAVLFIAIPLNQLKGIVRNVKTYFEIPIIYYDVDVPLSLPGSGGLTFNHYIGADVSEYDAFIIPSEDYKSVLEAMGAKKVFVLHFGVDPQVYTPLYTTKDIDVFFYGSRSRGREDYLRIMISEPSQILNSSFLVSGGLFNVDLGNAVLIPKLPFNSFRDHCCRSKINLNIARRLHAESFTSTSRPFELAALECCVVSMPYKGLDKWFRLGKEMFMVESSEEAVETYKWLLCDDETRMRVGKAAREKVLKRHTIKHRVSQLLQIIKDTK